MRIRSGEIPVPRISMREPWVFEHVKRMPRSIPVRAGDGLQPGGTWTSPDGRVHIRNAGTLRTYCGQQVGACGTRPAAGCDACVTASISDYAGTLAQRWSLPRGGAL
ncbi:hypothetical protein GCM10009854_09710 [Saccharopolyspora halophila]|uniref:Uncharacterized protein n=1 Tax=Saccharopolyspora halophila TaxID=405551 RepID=A0ABN3FR54_9PSEU